MAVPRVTRPSRLGIHPCSACMSSASQSTWLGSADFDRRRGIPDRRLSWPTCWVTSVLPPLLALCGPAQRHILGLRNRLCNHLWAFLTLLKLRESGWRLRQRGPSRRSVRAAVTAFVNGNEPIYLGRNSNGRASHKRCFSVPAPARLMQDPRDGQSRIVCNRSWF
jgi:hypothetical protein